MSRLESAETAVLVAVGGFAGANLRYFLALFLPGLSGTLAANAAGSFLLGFVMYEAYHVGVLADRTRVVAATGFLSSFTTYSTFAVESLQSAPLVLAGNVAANYALALLGVLVGRALARALGGDA
ncbi:CrcB family protein [Salarchaeum japonicum]|uniref:Fluoride-specific ion channel FluC n=1 Tax=Salarchaeum japonicum TaxID=555573 RepID=A0AAV3T4N5_9EURY|nr:CrcB family protein [Salarchaeum japonicum]